MQDLRLSRESLEDKDLNMTIQKVFDWKEQDEMQAYVSKLRKKGYYVYQDVAIEEDVIIIYADKNPLTPKKLNDEFDLENYQGMKAILKQLH